MQPMKKLTAALLLLTGAASALPQGSVTFQNCVVFNLPDPTGGNRLVYDVGSPLDPVAGVGLTGTQYVAELFVGANASSLTPVTDSISRFRSTTTANKGCWASTGIYGQNDFLMLPGFDINSIPILQVTAWDFGLLPTFEE